VAAYLAGLVGYPPESIIGTRERTVYLYVGRVLKRLVGDEYKKLAKEARALSSSPLKIWPKWAAARLLATGYVGFNEDGYVVINGRPMVEILVEHGVPRSTAERIEAHVARCLAAVAATWGVKLPPSPRLFRMLMASDVLVAPDYLKAKYKGKPLWHHLSEREKKEYIKRAGAAYLYEMLSSPVFVDMHQEVWRRLGKLRGEVGSSVSG